MQRQCRWVAYFMCRLLFCLSAAKIADELGTTRAAVIGRLHRLSRVELTYPSYIRRRARVAARRKERKRVESTAIAKMRQEIARGVSRNRAIARARKSGATLRALGKALGISLQWVRQMA